MVYIVCVNVVEIKKQQRSKKLNLIYYFLYKNRKEIFMAKKLGQEPDKNGKCAC